MRQGLACTRPLRRGWYSDMSHEQFAALYDRGMAVGESDIRTDSMKFNFRGEEFIFPTAKVAPYAFYNGYFYECPIDKLRELEREAVSP